MKVMICGSSGMVGQSLLRIFQDLGIETIVCTRAIVDLTKREDVFQFIRREKPNVVIDAAAKVGGIIANSSFPVKFFIENVSIQNNLMEASNEFEVAKFIFLGSSCVYPRMSEQPMKEEFLMTGKLENTNSAYAMAKLAGIELLSAYRRQFKRRWITVVPSNLYGMNDYFNEVAGHVIPSMIRKFDSAINSGASKITLLGTGQAIREFLYVDDLSRAIFIALRDYDDDIPINVGSGEEIKIENLAMKIGQKMGFKGEIEWNGDSPDGTLRKLLDSTKILSLGWKPLVKLDDGLDQVIDWYVASKTNGTLRV